MNTLQAISNALGPCRGRPREFCVDAALAQALRVFWEKGYEGTSLNDLTEAMGITRPSLYAAFGNKDALFRKALDLYETEKLAPFQIGAEDEQKRLEQKKVTRTDEFARLMAERLDAIHGVTASFELHAGENHMSILPVTVNRAVQAAFAARGLASADAGARDRLETRAALSGPEPLATRVLDAVRERLGASRDEEILLRPSSPDGDVAGRRPRDLFLSGPEYGPADGAAVEISDSFTVAVDASGYVAASRIDTAGPDEEEDAREFVRALARGDRIAADDGGPPDTARLYREGKTHFVIREGDGVRRVRRAWIAKGAR